MAPLPFNMLGYVFESGVDSLRESFMAASAGVKQQVGKAEKSLEEYKTDLENGGKWIGEREDGHIIWDQEQVLEYEIDAAQEAYGELRKAFCIAGYHYWERSIRKYCKDHRSNHSELVKKAITEGFPVSQDLTRVHRLANALKHNSDYHGQKLQVCWPDVISVLYRQGRHVDWYAVIGLRDEHVHEVLDIIRASGPQSDLAEP